MHETSDVTLALQTGLLSYQVEDEEGRIHLLLHLPEDETVDPRIGIGVVSRNFPFRINGGRPHRGGAGRQERADDTVAAAHKAGDILAGKVASRSGASRERAVGCRGNVRRIDDGNRTLTISHEAPDHRAYVKKVSSDRA
jgi:hypothetical protein